jgi:hypothetical protein
MLMRGGARGVRAQNPQYINGVAAAGDGLTEAVLHRRPLSPRRFSAFFYPIALSVTFFSPAAGVLLMSRVLRSVISVFGCNILLCSSRPTRPVGRIRVRENG